MSVGRWMPVSVLLISLVLPFWVAASPPEPHVTAAVRFYPSPDPLMKAMPFSEAVRAGDFLLLSGQIGSLPGKMALAPGGITGESRQALDNIRNILQRHGATLGDVVKCTAFLADMKDWPAFNAVYREYFKSPYPARSATGATGLAMGARVELECMAYVPGTARTSRDH